MYKKMKKIVLVSIMAAMIVGCGAKKAENIDKTSDNDAVTEQDYEKNSETDADLEDGSEKAEEVETQSEEKTDEKTDAEDTSIEENETNNIENKDNVDEKTKNDATVMAKYLMNCPERTRYGIYDIDGDGSVELYVAENDSHADCVTIFVIDSSSNELLELGSFGSFGSMTYYPGGYVIGGYTGQGEMNTRIAKITGETLTVVHTLWDNEGLVETGCEYKVDDVSVTKDEYYEIYNQYNYDDAIYIEYSELIPIDDYDVMYNNILDAISCLL